MQEQAQTRQVFMGLRHSHDHRVRACTASAPAEPGCSLQKTGQHGTPDATRSCNGPCHQTRAAYEEYARTLPWSAEPLPGWEAEKQLHSGFRSSKPDSPGYTEEQHAEVARFRAELLELSSTVSTHPFWEQMEQGQVVDARMWLKHQHEAPEAA
ncbi:hypothetical protein [Streptomyces sp. NPDC047097]|uniref:hypothetical protein n=1 Tax=Streptomyces sp. NPDC047097 TaxID=3155260 RepID=UPI0033E26216